MALYLVRHAVAVGRSSWKGDDDRRPLTPKGKRQARALVRLLDDAEVRRIYTSPALRCADTVVPLAEARRLALHTSTALAEGHGDTKAHDLLTELAAKRGDSVLCTHGDLIPDLLRRLARAGTALESELQYAKGSTWELEVDGATITAAHYHPPAE